MMYLVKYWTDLNGYIGKYYLFHKGIPFIARSILPGLRRSKRVKCSISIGEYTPTLVFLTFSNCHFIVMRFTIVKVL